MSELAHLRCRKQVKVACHLVGFYMVSALCLGRDILRHCIHKAPWCVGRRCGECAIRKRATHMLHLRVRANCKELEMTAVYKRKTRGGALAGEVEEREAGSVVCD